MARRRVTLVSAQIERKRSHIDNRRRLLDELIIGEGNVHAAAESMRALHASLYGDEPQSSRERCPPAPPRASKPA
jgi:hypothetical protein